MNYSHYKKPECVVGYVITRCGGEWKNDIEG